MKSKTLLKTVGVYTANEYLFQKIKLELYEVAQTFMLSAEEEGAFDILLVDADDPAFQTKEGMKMKRGGGDISLPFKIGTLLNLIDGKKRAFIEPIPSQKSVRIGEKTIKLTELEYALFHLLFSAGGEYVSREEILGSVWEGRADKGIVNVYVHYLREKLECDGEKIIISSRNYGYKLSEKYIGGESDAQAD